jgi:transcriptional regulator with XRE-family HTH domain
LTRKRINPTRSEGLDGDVWERLLADIRGHIFEFGDFKKLSEQTGLCVGTISRLAYGETGSPHMRTVIKVMDALGKSDPVLKAFRSEKPISTVQAFALKLKRGKYHEQRKTKLQKKTHPHRIAKPVRRSRERSTTLH